MRKNNIEKICAIILCGGKGTRLGKVGKKINKTLIKYKGNPLIYYIIKYLFKNYKKYYYPFNFLPVDFNIFSFYQITKKQAGIFLKLNFKI